VTFRRGSSAKSGELIPQKSFPGCKPFFFLLYTCWYSSIQFMSFH
jgi:hypothetical protein